MLKISGDFDLLTVMQKVEVFTEALRRTTGKGNDMYEILWRYVVKESGAIGCRKL